MKKSAKKLTLARETLDLLTQSGLKEIGGAGTWDMDTCAPCRIETWPIC